MQRDPGEDALTITSGVNEAHAAYVTERLRAFNLTHLPADQDTVPLEIFILDSAGKVIGGLVGRTVWGWLEIGILWVDEHYRNRGLGSELMDRAETEGRRRGCTVSRLSTWDFQALEFYARRGYTPYGRLDGYPAGHTVHYVRKELS